MTSSSDAVWLAELDPADVARPRGTRRTGAVFNDARADAVRAAVARAAAEATRRGFRDGHDAGYKAGHREGVRAARDETRATVATLHAAACDVQQRAATDLADASRAIAAAALELAEAIIGRHIATADDPGAEALARALALAPGVPLTARLHPEDAALLDTSLLPDDGRVTVVSDPAIERGGCVLEGGATTIDAQISPALARARQALLDDNGALA
jgi:flagellar assembly protein FliH